MKFENPFGAERIVAAACRWQGEVYSLPAPARHGDVMRHINRHADADAIIVPDDQGFLTSKGRYVNRFEARDIARLGGQAKSPQHPDQLFSEDVW